MKERLADMTRSSQLTTTAVVTGGGRGIGLAIARMLAQRGHQLVITDVDAEAAERAASEIGRGAVGLRQDVREIGSHREVADEAAKLGPVAVWVNNAGILFAGNGWDHPDGELTSILEVNVRGVMAGSAAAVGVMGPAGGGILNIASISAYSPVPGLAIYAATKAAVLSYTISLEGDLRHAGLPIRARALSPDVVGTKMVTSRAEDPNAALLFSGPKPLTEDKVARAGLALLESRHVSRAVPHWRGAMARSLGIVPTAGLGLVGVMRGVGDRRQART
jgi:short-subunit dehydrogenase